MDDDDDFDFYSSGRGAKKDGEATKRARTEYRLVGRGGEQSMGTGARQGKATARKAAGCTPPRTPTPTPTPTPTSTSRTSRTRAMRLSTRSRFCGRSHESVFISTNGP